MNSPRLKDLIAMKPYPCDYQIRVEGKDYKVVGVSNPDGDGNIKVRLGTNSYADKEIKVTGFEPAKVDYVK